MKSPSVRWLVAPIALAAALRLAAQDSQKVTVNSVVQTVLALEVDNNTVQINFGADDYDANGAAEKQVANATTFTVSANVAWRLQVRSESLLFSYTGKAGIAGAKPCAHLSMSPRDSNSYSPASVVGREIAVGGPGGASDPGHSVPVSYKLSSTLAGDPPGDYRLTLVYTVMAL